MIAQADIRQEINFLYEEAKHGPNRQVLDELMLLHTLTLQAVLAAEEDPEEQNLLIIELQEKLRDRLLMMG